MEFAIPILIFLLVAAIIITIAVTASIMERKRKAALAEFASRWGLSFRPERDYELAKAFRWLDALARGSNRYAYHIMSGAWQNHEILLFDYHYQVTTSNGKTTRTSHYHMSVFALTLPVAFPELRIVPENLGSKIAQAFGWEDIDFESAEFSRKFVVRSKDRKFAYDVCHPRMMEFLLAHPNLQVEIEGQVLATWSAGRLQPEGIGQCLDRSVALRKLMPDYLFAESGTHA